MKKILYVAPHLSTGGLPQYLTKKIELIKDDYEVHLVEWEDCTGGVLVVQRNKLKNLLSSHRFYTLNENKNRLFDIINQVKPDIIHLEEIPEYFMDYDISVKLYNTNRDYIIVETSHDSSFDTTKKLFFPDKFMFVSEWQVQQYKDVDVPKTVVYYPIEYKERPDRTQALEALGLNPGKKHVLHIGLFTPRKNQAEFFDYARSLPEYEFHCVGNQADNFKYYWEPLMENKPDNVTWWNERSDVDNFYSAMDLFLFTSRGSNTDKETMPLVIREALSWNMNLLIYNLPVYLDYFNQFDNVNYLDFDNFERNVKIIKENLPQGKLNYWFESDGNKIHFSSPLDNYYIVLLDSKTQMPNCTFGPFSLNAEFWVSSNANGALNGIDIVLYNEDKNFIEQHHIVDFNRDNILRVNGEEIILSRDNFDSSCFWSFYEVVLHNDYKHIPENSDLILDIGANLGITSLHMLNKGTKQIYSFEPSSKALPYLTKNVEKYPNIKVIDKAISFNDNETLRFYTDEIASSVGSLVEYQSNNFTDFEEVTTININTFFKENNIGKVDYVKLDCEGGEKPFFETITDKNLKKIQIIEGEIHDDIIGPEFKDYIRERLELNNFEVEFEQQKEHLYIITAKQIVNE